MRSLCKRRWRGHARLRNQRDARLIEERNAEWAAKRAERERSAANAEMLRARQSDTWVMGHITCALAERDQYWRAVHAEVLAEQHKRMDDALAKLRADFELRLGAQTAEIAKLRAVADGGVVDLLPPVPHQEAQQCGGVTNYTAVLF